MTTELTQKLENIISGHSINEDDADWLRALTAAQPAQADGPIAAALGDIVAVWDQHAPSEYMTAQHMQAKRALAGQQPMSPDMARWCAYVGGMVAHWVKSEPDALARLGDDAFEAAIAGIIERRLWAMPKPAPQQATPEQDVGVSADYWGDLAQQKADADARRGVSMPVSYYTSSVVGALLAAQQATPEPVGEPAGEAGAMPGTQGFTMACFHADKVPVGAKLYTRPAPGVPAKLPSAYATSTEDGTWRVLLAFDNKDDAEATRRFLHDHGVQPRTMRSSAPGVPEDSELLDYLDTLATRAAGSDLHCFGGRVALYVRTGIGSQIEASGAGTAREAIRAALAAAQAKGDQS